MGSSLQRACASVGLVALLAGCDVGDDDASTADEADISATSGTFKLSLNALTAQSGVARVHGLANQPLESAFAFIPDDQVGSTHNAPKSFTSSFSSGEVRLFLNGRPAFFSINLAGGGHFDARGDLGVKMHTDTSAGIKVTSATQSVFVGGAALVRVKGTFSSTLVSAKATAGSTEVAGVVSGKSWRFDFTIPDMSDAITKKTKIPISVTTSSGTTTGELDAALVVKQVALTTEDPYEVWAAPSCEPSVLTCLQQPANAVDASACGDAFHVAPCWNQVPH